MSKYANLIKAAKAESHKTIELESQENGKLEKEITSKSLPLPSDKGVNLTIKVPEAFRRHWAGQAKLQGLTLTAVITEALTERFGQPEQ